MAALPATENSNDGLVLLAARRILSPSFPFLAWDYTRQRSYARRILLSAGEQLLRIGRGPRCAVFEFRSLSPITRSRCPGPSSLKHSRFIPTVVPRKYSTQFPISFRQIPRFKLFLAAPPSHQLPGGIL
jgi:hypothetical protein